MIFGLSPFPKGRAGHVDWFSDDYYAGSQFSLALIAEKVPG